MKNHSIRPHAKLHILCLIIATVVVSAKLILTHEVEHVQLTESIHAHAQAINDNVTFAVEEAYALQALVIGAEGGEVDLSQIGPELYRADIAPFIRCLALAPNGTVTQVYPLQGNEIMLGTDQYADSYLWGDDDAGTPSSGNSLIIHPLVLPDGSRVLSGRLRVFLTREDGSRYEWGVVSVCVSFPQALEAMGNGILESRDYAYRISVKEQSSDGYKELTNSHFEGVNHRITEDFTLHTVQLRLEAYAIGGWISPREVIFTILTAVVGVYAVGFVVEIVVAQLRRLWLGATEDSMTGLLNRSSAKQRIERAVKDKSFQKGAFLLMDIDHFKEVNDCLGHQRGDRVLVECAAIFKQLFREEDVLCRLGGDEFVIFMSVSRDMKFLDDKVAKLLRAMHRDVVGTEEVVTISASVGVALVPEHGTSFEELYKNADVALYNAKNSGRDRAIYYHTELAGKPTVGTPTVETSTVETSTVGTPTVDQTTAEQD